MLHLYAVDWDSYGPRGEDVTVDDGSGPRTVKLATGSFVNGAWTHFSVDVPAGGSVLVKANRTAGGTTNAVLSGLFLGGPGCAPASAPHSDAHADPDPAAGRPAGCPGQLGRQLRGRRLRPGRLDRECGPGQPAGRGDVHRGPGLALQLGGLDDRRPGAPEPEPGGAPGADLVPRDEDPAPAQLHQRLQRDAPPLCRRLGRLRASWRGRHGRRRLRPADRPPRDQLVRPGRLDPRPGQRPGRRLDPDHRRQDGQRHDQRRPLGPVPRRPRAGPDAHADPDSDANPYADPRHSHADPDAHADPDSHAYAYSNAAPHSDAHADPDPAAGRPAGCPGQLGRQLRGRRLRPGRLDRECATWSACRPG